MSIFKITDMQRHQIVSSIQYYIDNLDNPTLKKSYLEKIKDEDFENKMIYSFAEMNFLSQSLIVSIRKMFDFNVIAQKILDNSVNDEYEIKELKLFVINRLLDERLISLITLTFFLIFQISNLLFIDFKKNMKLYVTSCFCFGFYLFYMTSLLSLYCVVILLSDIERLMSLNCSSLLFEICFTSLTTSLFFSLLILNCILTI